MHLRKGVLRSALLSVALVALALPLSSQTAPAVHAQINPPLSSASGAGSITEVSQGNVPAANVNGVLVAFNVLGFSHTATFTCANAGGCYDVIASVNNDTLGTSTTINSSTCAGASAVTTGSTATCVFLNGPGMNGEVATPGDSAAVTINPGSPDIYSITFTGYVPATATRTCPAGTGAGATSTTGGTSVTYTPLFGLNAGAAGAYCAFAVTAQKKYIEITSLTPVGGPCTGNVVYSEGLKGFLGPSCTIGFVGTGTVNVKSVADCPTELRAIGTPNANGQVPVPVSQQGEYGTKAVYVCIGNQLAVTNVAVPAGLPITISLTNLGPATGVSLGTQGSSFCLGQSVGSVSATTVAASTTSTPPPGNVTLCPTGVGPTAFSACITSTINTQAPVCSASVPGLFTLPTENRTVPYVKWAGEKTVLTKCFGGGGLMANAAVEFTLKGNNPGLNATLLPLTTPGTGAVTSASTDTVWTITDSNGCASTMLYADGEGVAYVDAALFSTATGAAGGTPIINEHAFEVFYLKFDHLDIQNLSQTGATYSSSVAFGTNPSDLTLLAGAPDWPGIGGNSTLVASITTPDVPTPAAAGSTVSIPVCNTDYVRAMVHGYFEISGDPSGRPAASVTIPGAPTGAVGSFTLPAGRWVLPEDWPVLATFAGFNAGTPISSGTTASVYAWDINSGFAFNPGVEGAVLCTGPLADGSTDMPSANTAGPIGNFNTGPCFGYDAETPPVAYSTAPDQGCSGGTTVGIGPFDITQACYNILTAAGAVVTGSGLQFAPAGSSILAQNCGGASFCTVPTSQNSTYLPNGTLSQWDAPMPPAQITFVNTGTTGTLSEVNKSGLYSFTLATGNSSTGATPTVFYYNPFYAEAIPSSPAIPPVTNNGGYLWNSWNFTGGTITGTTTAAGYVAGQSSVVPAGLVGITAALCPTGTAYTAAPAFGPSPACQSTVAVYTSAAACATAFPGYTNYNINTATGTAGLCDFAVPMAITASTPGGITTTDLGANCGGFINATDHVTVADATGFQAGETVEIYNRSTGATEATGVTIASVAGNVLNFSGPVSFTGGTAGSSGCSPAYTEVVVAEQFGIPVANMAPFAAGTGVTLIVPGDGTVSVDATGTTMTANGTTYVLLQGTEAIAHALGGCFLSRGAGPFPGTAPGAEGASCEPGTLVPAGTVVSTGPATGGTIPPTAAPPNPYPFWQWVPSASPAGGASSGTVYSDNHGEAVVALNTPFSSLSQSVTPVPAGGCASLPGGAYVTTFNSAGAPLGCILPIAALGTSAYGGFSNVAAASKGANNTCYTASATGVTAVATPTGTPQPVVGANGPTGGQICKNSLGAIELGSQAVLGSTTIQAIAEYPYTRGEHPQIASNPLTKVFTSAFVKSVAFAPGTSATGTAGPAGTTTYTIQVTAQDVCGKPISAEPIQVFALGNAGSVVLAPMAGTGGSVISSSSNSAVVTVGTNGTATLSLEVLTANLGTQGLVVKVVFPYEQIERFLPVIAGTGQTTFFQQTYGPGWNQVGGPAGSNFGVAEALFDYNSTAGTYTDVTATSTNISSAPPNCTGYWAYFANAVSVSLPVTNNATPATCTVSKGWVLLGNPFTTPATLPAGVTAYHWNGTAYVVTNQIPVGGSVWVDNTAGTLTTVVLTP